ncbi:MAG: hypothetical protein WBA10_21400, partial [Elainellaceae cyanobacterium]
ATLIPMDGGGYGVAVMLLLAHPITPRWWIAWIGLHGLLFMSGGILSMQLWAIPSPLLVMLATSAGRGVIFDKEHSSSPEPDLSTSPIPNLETPSLNCRGSKPRWFYWFYPGHLLALWLVRQMV